jgi:hypothetical protein
MLLGFAVGLTLVTGVHSLQATRLHSATGWICTIGPSLVVILTVDRWVKVMPGILSYATLAGVIVTSTGHLLNQPHSLIPRWQAAALTILLAVSAALFLPLAKSRLGSVERVAILMYAACLVWASATSGAVMLLAGSLALAVLVTVRLYDHHHARHTMSES